MSKQYTIEIIKKEKLKVLDELKKYFGYTIQVGHSYNKINDNPKAIKGLISTLNKSYDEKEDGFNRTSAEEVKTN